MLSYYFTLCRLCIFFMLFCPSVLTTFGVPSICNLKLQKFSFFYIQLLCTSLYPKVCGWFSFHLSVSPFVCGYILMLISSFHSAQNQRFCSKVVFEFILWWSFNLLYTGNPLNGYFANRENPDEMQHNAAFHQCLHCLQRLKQPSGIDIHHAVI